MSEAEGRRLVSKETSLVEKRRYPRQSFSKGSALSAKVILSGGSLLEATSPRTIEIGTKPLNISQGGICLSLFLDVPWETLTPSKQVSLLLTVSDQVWLLPAMVVRHERDHRTIALKFVDPLPSLIPFLTPRELQ